MKKFIIVLLSIVICTVIFSEEIKLRAAKYYDGTYCFINENGDVVISGNYIQANEFKEGLARVKVADQNDEVYIFIDMTGKIVLEPKRIYMPEYNNHYMYDFTFESDFSDGLAIVTYVELNKEKDEFLKYKAAIDSSGNIMFKFDSYDYQIFDFHEGLAKFYTNRKYGYIDRTGQIVIPPTFAEADPFNEGVARIQYPNNNKWGFIGTDGKILLKPDYKIAFPFYNNRSLVIDSKDNIGYINKEGNFIIDIMDILTSIKQVLGDNVRLEGLFNENNFHFTNTALLAFSQQSGDFALSIFNTSGEEEKTILLKQPPNSYQYKYNFFGFFEGLAWIYNGINPEYRCLNLNGEDAFIVPEIKIIYERDENFKKVSISNFFNGLAKVLDANGNTCYLNTRGIIVYTE